MALQELNPSHSPKRRRGRGEGLQAVHMAEAHRELEETVRGIVDTSQIFGLSKTEPSYLSSFAPYDGILGLAFSNVSSSGATPVFENMMTGVFVILSLANNSCIFPDSPLSLLVMFSGIDSSYYSGSLNWIPLSYWEITMDSITMNGHLISCANGWQAIVDIGTSVLAGALTAISKILHCVGARGDSSNLISCSAKHTLPDIIFTINGIRFPLPATAYIRQCTGPGGVNFFLETGGIRDGCWSQKPAQVGMNELSGTDRIAMECPAEITEDQQLGTDWQPREADHSGTATGGGGRLLSRLLRVRRDYIHEAME
ncbi:unnamed protein product [Lepidochelys kempii]